MTEEQIEETAAALRRDVDRLELERLRALSDKGAYFLRVARDAFAEMGHGTDVTDLDEFLDDAREVHATLTRALVRP